VGAMAVLSDSDVAMVFDGGGSGLVTTGSV